MEVCFVFKGDFFFKLTYVVKSYIIGKITRAAADMVFDLDKNLQFLFKSLCVLGFEIYHIFCVYRPLV